MTRGTQKRDFSESVAAKKNFYHPVDGRPAIPARSIVIARGAVRTAVDSVPSSTGSRSEKNGATIDVAIAIASTLSSGQVVLPCLTKAS